MAATSTEAFFDVLAKSELLPAAKLTEVRGKLETSEDGKAAARELVKLGLLTKWQAGMLLTGISLLKLGRYTLLDQIGTEEAGRVYLAEHVQMGRRVVIRTLSSKLTGNPQAVKCFLDEAQRIAALHHRNIIHLFDVSSEGDRYFIVLEHAEGRDFQAQVSATGPLPRELAADYLLQVAEGLAHAHSKGLFHGDIKAENLLVDGHGQVKILNFGVARLVEGSATTADAATDLAALGEVGTYLLTGKSGLADRVSAPPGIETICLRLASKSADDRIASADEAIAALKKWQAESRSAGPGAAPKIQRTAAEKVEKAPPKPKAKPPALTRPAPKRAEPLTEAKGEMVGAGEAAASTGGAVAAVADLPQINISVSRARPKANAKAKSKPAKEKLQQQPAAENESEAATKATSKLPLALLIGGGGAAALAALLLVAVGGYFFVWPPAQKQVASADKEGASKLIDAQPNGKSEVPEPDPKPEPEKPAEPPGPGPKALVAPVEPAKPEPAKPEPAKPDPPPVVAEKPVVPEKPVDPPKEPVPAPPPTPAQNPFLNLPKIAELPALGTADKPSEDATKPVSLGALTLPPKDLLFIDLAGGDKTTKGKLAFFMKPAKGGTADRDWEISMSSTGDAGAGSVVALVSVKDDKLNFEWTEKGAAEPLANQLRNCVLNSRTGAFTHSLALRKPVEASPLTVSFEKAIKGDVPVEYAPSAEAIEIEITSLDGPFPTHKLAPKPTLEAAKGKTDLLLGKDKEETLILRVESSLKKNVSLVVTPYFRLAMQRQTTEVKYSNKAFDQAAQFVTMANAQAFNVVDGMNKITNPTVQQQTFKSEAEKVFAKCQTALAQVEDLKTVCKSLNNTGKIHFRIYYIAGDQQVDLVRTAPAAPADAGTNPPAADPAAAPPK